VTVLAAGGAAQLVAGEEVDPLRWGERVQQHLRAVVGRRVGVAPRARGGIAAAPGGRRGGAVPEERQHDQKSGAAEHGAES
jgi:hypothetical protein